MVIVPMPLNLAVFGVNRAADVIAAHPEVEHWGHRRPFAGRQYGCQFHPQQPDLIDGLFLVASHPASSDDLSADDLTTYLSRPPTTDWRRPTRSTLPARFCLLTRSGCQLRWQPRSSATTAINRAMDRRPSAVREQ